jgi:hypothetical protein
MNFKILSQDKNQGSIPNMINMVDPFDMAAKVQKKKFNQIPIEFNLTQKIVKYD